MTGALAAATAIDNAISNQGYFAVRIGKNNWSTAIVFAGNGSFSNSVAGYAVGPNTFPQSSTIRGSGNPFGTFQQVAVPEPGTLALLGLGLAGLGLSRRRKAV